MPAVALVGAAASISAGVGALAAGAAGLSALAAGAMVAGGVLTGLGTLTGNKKLTKIGAVLGLAGGVGMALSSASNAASAGLNSVGGEGVSMGSAAGNAGSNAVEMGLADGVGGATAGIGEAATSAIMPQSGIIGQNIGPALGDTATMADFSPQLGGGGMNAASAPLAGTEAATQQITAAAGQGGIQGPSIAGAATPVASNPLGTALDKVKGFGKGAWGFVTDPKNAQVVKAGSGLVQGAMGAYSRQAEIDAQLAQREAERQRYNRSILGSYMNR